MLLRGVVRAVLGRRREELMLLMVSGASSSLRIVWWICWWENDVESLVSVEVLGKDSDQLKGTTECLDSWKERCFWSSHQAQ